MRVRIGAWIEEGARRERGIPLVGQTFTSPSHWSVSDGPFVFHKAGHSSKAAIKSRTFSPIIPPTWTPTPNPADVPVYASIACRVAHFCPVQLSKKHAKLFQHGGSSFYVTVMTKFHWLRTLPPNRTTLSDMQFSFGSLTRRHWDQTHTTHKPFTFTWGSTEKTIGMCHLGLAQPIYNCVCDALDAIVTQNNW